MHAAQKNDMESMGILGKHSQGKPKIDASISEPFLLQEIAPSVKKLDEKELEPILAPHSTPHSKKLRKCNS